MFVVVPYEQLIRSLLLAAFLVYLFRHGRYSQLIRRRGGQSIVLGVFLILAGTFVDIYHYTSFDHYTPLPGSESLLEFSRLAAYTSGVIFFFFGLARLIPAVVQLEATEESLRESEQRFRDMFEYNPDAVILARLDDHTVIDVNPTWVEETGISRKDAIGKTSEELNVWTNPSLRMEFKERLLKDGQVRNMEVEFNISGEQKCGLVSARIINLHDEQYILFLVRDVTAAKKAERTMHEVNRMRNEFISTAAHELLTPLSVMIGYADLLASRELSGEVAEKFQDEALDVISQKGKELSRIVDDLLDISRFEQGQMLSIEIGDVDPASLLTRIVENFRVYSPKHDFELNLSEQGPRIMDADERRLVQVMENLLSNAVKYSPDGSRIKVSKERTAEHCIIHVEDNGIGMTPEQLSRIFDKFYRADASNTAISGLGLGMNVVLQVVDAHGGEISLDSEPGQGTRVTVKLPWFHAQRSEQQQAS